MLKACEGMAKLTSAFVGEEIQRNWLTRLSVLPASTVLHRLKNRIDPRRRNGATLLGLNGIVIKSHGGADALAFACAVEEAYLEIGKNIPVLINKWVQTENS